MDLRYADACINKKGERIICVREDHTRPGVEATNTIVSLSLEGNDDGGLILAAGNDFYSSPKVSPDGSQVAWLTWNHPNMPWDGCELWVGSFAADGSLTSSRKVAGGLAESIFQPEWSPDGTLYFASDKRGWWNLHRLSQDGATECLLERNSELGMPQWVFGMSSYAFFSADSIICSHVDQGVSRLTTFNTRTGKVAEINS